MNWHNGSESRDLASSFHLTTLGYDFEIVEPPFVYGQHGTNLEKVINLLSASTTSISYFSTEISHESSLCILFHRAVAHSCDDMALEEEVDNGDTDNADHVRGSLGP